MRVLLIDPSMAGTGYAVLEFVPKCYIHWNELWEIRDFGIIMSKPGQHKGTTYMAHDDLSRVSEITRKLMDVAKATEPNGIIAEIPLGGGKSFRAIRSMALCSALIGTLKECLMLPAEYYTPEQTRRAACGKRNASKNEVIEAMGKLWPAILEAKTKAEREAVADALSAGVAGWNDGVLMRRTG